MKVIRTRSLPPERLATCAAKYSKRAGVRLIRVVAVGEPQDDGRTRAAGLVGGARAAAGQQAGRDAGVRRSGVPPDRCYDGDGSLSFVLATVPAADAAGGTIDR